MRTPATPSRAKISRFDAKNSMTPQISQTRFTRDANAPYAGTNPSIRIAWPAEA